MGSLSGVDPAVQAKSCPRCPLGARASRPQRAEGPQLTTQVFKRARCPRSRERHHLPRWSAAKPRYISMPAASSPFSNLNTDWVGSATKSQTSRVSVGGCAS